MLQLPSNPKELELLEPWTEQTDETLHKADWTLQLFWGIHNKTEELVSIKDSKKQSNPKSHDFIFSNGKWIIKELATPRDEGPRAYYLYIPPITRPGFDYPGSPHYVTLYDVKTALGLLNIYNLRTVFDDYMQGQCRAIYTWHSRDRRMSPTPKCRENMDLGRAAQLLTVVL